MEKTFTTMAELEEALALRGVQLVPVSRFKPWNELKEALALKGLNLIDVSRDSKHAVHTNYSLQYLTDLRSGRYVAGPSEKVLAEVARVLGCPVEDLRPGRVADEPEALAS
jgi:transcriptional regulator with XRE-family HTH domain